MAKLTGRTKSDLLREAVRQMTARLARHLDEVPTAYDRLREGDMRLVAGSGASSSLL